ncbi:MAG TPA: hypothetical protein VEA69_07645 [Tepidisphaeraceae bacterium]|nr:hypothetical protein [Tepidisphaeraceae bacterium]
MVDYDAQPMLEYHRPPVVAEVRLRVGRALALGYVGACVVGLVVMGIVMAARL